MNMKVGSIFAGVGGFDLGFQRAGGTIKWQIEIDKQCQGVLTKHFPCTQIISDIKQVTDGLKDVDVVTAGFPCQDASVIQSIRDRWSGINGERTGLFWEVARLADRYRWQWLVLENVKGLLSVDQGESFRQVIRALDELGYVGEWRVLDGAAFGLPMRREHLVIAAHNSRDFGNISQPGAATSLLADPEDWNTSRQQLPQGTRQAWTENSHPIAGQHYRKLTPEECEMALGFPEGWTEGQSNRVRYKQMGNAVAVPVAEWVANRISIANRRRAAQLHNQTNRKIHTHE